MKLKEIDFKKNKYFMHALGNKTRFNILRLLFCSPMSVKKICSMLRLRQSKISTELQTLRSLGYVGYKSDGNYRIYFLNKQIGNTISSVFRLLRRSRLPWNYAGGFRDMR